MNRRQQLGKSKRWVVKIGSALLTNDGKGLDHQAIATWSAQMAQLHSRGVELVLVSSGAIAAGMTRLGWAERPHVVHELQAAAAVGQMGLIQAYESCFQSFDMYTAQVLLGHDDLSARDRYLNARKTLATLLDLGVIPIVNENDTVVTDEIRFGDNDTLGALVANLVGADLLVILTDQRGLFKKDPRKYPDAQLVSNAEAGDTSLEVMAGSGAGALGRGGMITKVRAAKLAARSGTDTIIAGGSVEGVLLKLADGEEEGTLLTAKQRPIAARKQWLAGMLKVAGCLELDDGAVRVLKQSGRSLLAVGVCRVSGDFKRGDLVSCVDGSGVEVARGLVNYDAQEADRLMGQASERIEELLGYRDEEELIHRDNLVLT